jgi:hypothetical protein
MGGSSLAGVVVWGKKKEDKRKERKDCFNKIRDQQRRTETGGVSASF